MPRLAIIEPVVCAGGVERFVHGLVQGAIEERITDDWEIVLVRNQVNTAGIHVPWPEHLRKPSIKIVYPEPAKFLARQLEKLSTAHRFFGIPGTGRMQRDFARWVRSKGPRQWRAYCGDIASWVEDYLRTHPVDVVYCPYPDLVAPPRFAQPIVITLHDLVFKHVTVRNSPEDRLRDGIIRKWLSIARYVVHSSQYIAGELKEFYPEFTAKSNVVRLGIPSPKCYPDAAEVEALRARLNLPQRFVLIAGSLMRHKNQHVVFEAIAKLRKRGVDVPLVCVGPNCKELTLSREDANRPANAVRYSTTIINICHESDLQRDRDYFVLGFVDDFTLECLYQCASMLVVPSITEAGSFPGQEAMRAGCPVIFSRTPPFLELMQLAEENAWSFAVNDSGELAERIYEVITQPEVVQQRTEAAMKIVPKVFSWKKTAYGYFDLFSRCCETATKR